MKITVHPLFLAVGALSLLFGGFPIFIICVLTALMHECGHMFCAAAVCDIEGISPADELRLALAGPAVNFFMCVAVAGLWWFVPDAYAYTDILFYSNSAMLVLNLLPAYPLDGGRAAKCLMVKFLKPKTADAVLRALNLCVVAVLVTLFFTVSANFSVLAVAALLGCSAFRKAPPARRIDFAARKKKRGREVKYIILDEKATFKDALKYLDSGKFLVFQFYAEKYLDEITEDELFEMLKDGSLYDPVLQSVQRN